MIAAGVDTTEGVDATVTEALIGVLISSSSEVESLPLLLSVSLLPLLLLLSPLSFSSSDGEATRTGGVDLNCVDIFCRPFFGAAGSETGGSTFCWGTTGSFLGVAFRAAHFRSEGTIEFSLNATVLALETGLGCESRRPSSALRSWLLAASIGTEEAMEVVEDEAFEVEVEAGAIWAGAGGVTSARGRATETIGVARGTETGTGMESMEEKISSELMALCVNWLSAAISSSFSLLRIGELGGASATCVTLSFFRERSVTRDAATGATELCSWALIAAETLPFVRSSRKSSDIATGDTIDVPAVDVSPAVTSVPDVVSKEVNRINWLSPPTRISGLSKSS
jgi:hypothetical protein